VQRKLNKKRNNISKIIN